MTDIVERIKDAENATHALFNHIFQDAREEIERLAEEVVRLQAKIAEMERQEPAYWGPKHAIEGGSTTVIVGKFPVNPTDAPLYALPGAKGE